MKACTKVEYIVHWNNTHTHNRHTHTRQWQLVAQEFGPLLWSSGFVCFNHQRFKPVSPDCDSIPTSFIFLVSTTEVDAVSFLLRDCISCETRRKLI